MDLMVHRVRRFAAPLLASGREPSGRRPYTPPVPDGPTSWSTRLKWLIAVVGLTVALAVTGGPLNPFSSLYLVFALVAALTLAALDTWVIVVGCGAAYGLLFLPPINPHAHHLDSHLLGMWIAYVVVAPLTAFAVRRLRRQLAESRSREVRTEKLTALATLAAGAAHEMATPLSTIHVVAHELVRATGDEGPLAEDARLIAAEVERAREVLGQLSADTGTSMGETTQTVTIDELIDAALQRLPDPDQVRRELGDLGGLRVRVPRRQLARALRGLIGNALLASPDAVAVSARRDGPTLELAIDDRGPGMPDELMARLGEPFLTTRPAGEGMGLGVFFARSVIDSAGGALRFERRDGGGTRARVNLPLES